MNNFMCVIIEANWHRPRVRGDPSHTRNHVGKNSQGQSYFNILTAKACYNITTKDYNILTFKKGLKKYGVCRCS